MANVLRGFGGDDTVQGGPGADDLAGGPGQDQIDGPRPSGAGERHCQLPDLQAPGRISCKLIFAGGAPAAVRARLSRGGRTYAVARTRVSSRSARIRLRPGRNAHRGAYKLVLRDANGTKMASLRVAIR